MRPVVVVPISFVIVAALAAGCDQVAEGKRELVAFGFDADTQLIPAAFSTSIGKGLRVGVRVYAAEKDTTPVPVLDAESADPRIAEVRGTAGNLITLEALAVGTVEIGVAVAAGEDAFDVTVKELSKVDLAYPGFLVPDNPKSLGVQGGTARFGTTLKDAAGAVLVGYGDVPVIIAPSGAAVATSKEVGYLEVQFATTGSVDITGQGDDKLTMEVVPQSALTGLEWSKLSDVKVGQITAGILRGVTADSEKVVGVASLATVTTTNPGICAVELAPNLGEGVFNVRGVSAGDCQIAATIGALAGRATFAVTP